MPRVVPAIGRTLVSGRAAQAAYYNLATRSNDFGHADWSVKQNVSVTTGGGGQAGPGGDGPTTCDSIVETTNTTVLHQLAQTSSGWSVGTVYGASVWLKASARAFANISNNGSGGLGPASSCVVDLTTGVVTVVPASLHSTLAAGAVSYGNGWWRVWMVTNYKVAGSFPLIVQPKSDGTLVANPTYASTIGTVALFVAGAQVNVGGLARYVPTVAAAVSGSAALRAPTALRVTP